MADHRPRSSPMPPQAAALGQSIVDRLKPMLDEAYAGILALGGSPTERENDALSMLAHVASFVGLQMTARMMMAKGHGPSIILPIVADEIGARIHAEIDRLARFSNSAGHA